jgi:cytoskeletal protein CcmA (bactofilin family)
MLFSRKSERRGNPERETPVAPEEPRGLSEPGHQPSPDTTRTPSFIDASLTIVGDLHSEGDVQIDGRVCGNVTCAQLIVGRDAVITGTVKAERAIVRGSITGTIRAPVVILQETARVNSDIAYSQLAIDDGAVFEGAAHRSENPLEEAETASALVELERLVATESPGAAGRLESKGHEPGSESGTGVALPKPDRRNANGHADAQR